MTNDYRGANGKITLISDIILEELLIHDTFGIVTASAVGIYLADNIADAENEILLFNIGFKTRKSVKGIPTLRFDQGWLNHCFYDYVYIF